MIRFFFLEVLAQLSNTEIARSDVVTRVRTQDLTVVCEFNFSRLPLHLRQKKKKVILTSRFQTIIIEPALVYMSLR